MCDPILRYPEIFTPFQFTLPFAFCFFLILPSLDGKRGSSLRSCCHSVYFLLLMNSRKPHVLAVRGDPLDGCQILCELSPSVQGTLYVDDLQIFTQSSNMRLIERQLQNAVNKLVSWCDSQGHTLSSEKSRCLHFRRKRNLHPDRGTNIPVVDNIRFLGVILDRMLTFLPHILRLRKMCEKSFNIFKVLSNTSWGADRTSLLHVHQAVILFRIDYGCMVYGSVRPSILRRLDTIHHSALI
ncbi:hypothetical protein AVEN_68491-1 [Araneus ventricosus]|uniref:Uncharacterized protein n=1 Tax=Araneus ventricosus TaxID=182803 RepID=A0A4Y2I644_ARAVE|nr:hypothetical protein AVEN_68491-1 [Araneus ventricosus]